MSDDCQASVSGRCIAEMDGFTACPDDHSPCAATRLPAAKETEEQ